MGLPFDRTHGASCTVSHTITHLIHSCPPFLGSTVVGVGSSSAVVGALSRPRTPLDITTLRIKLDDGSTPLLMKMRFNDTIGPFGSSFLLFFAAPTHENEIQRYHRC